MHSSREGQREIDRIKKDMGSYVFAAQYQQKPVIKEGGIIKDTWLMRYNKKINPTRIFLSFDTAIKAGLKNDPTVCSVWGELENNLYLLEIYREWLEYPDLKRKTLEFIKKWKPELVLIEDKASGQSLLQDLKKETRTPLIAVKVLKDKVTRLASVSAFFEAGKIFLPTEAEWLANYESELFSFPFCEHDDQVDSTSQFLDWYRNNNNFVISDLRVRRI